jgi:hypothetical protein
MPCAIPLGAIAAASEPGSQTVGLCHQNGHSAFSTPPALHQGSTAGRANSAMSSDRPDRRTTSFSPGREFLVPQPAMSSGRPDCCATSISPLTFTQPPRPLRRSGSQLAEGHWPFDSANVLLKNPNALIVAATATSSCRTKNADCDLDARLAAGKHRLSRPVGPLLIVSPLSQSGVAPCGMQRHSRAAVPSPIVSLATSSACEFLQTTTRSLVY